MNIFDTKETLFLPIGTLCIPMWKRLGLTFVTAFRSHNTAAQVS